MISLFPWKSAQNRFSSILVVKKIWKWGIVGNLILNNFIICNIWPKYVFTCQEIKEILGKCPKLSKNVQFYCRYLFFNFAFFSVFFGFQLPLETFWWAYRAIFLIFCPIWQENSFFCVKYSPFLLKLRKFLPKVYFVGENPGHFTKNSSISWQVGTHFEHNVSNEKLFRINFSTKPHYQFFQKSFQGTDYKK